MILSLLFLIDRKMKLVKYLPESALDSFLKDLCLRLTPSKCFEDKAEFGAQCHEFITNPELDNVINMHGVISLTKSETAPLMWTNYANNHKGFSFVLEADSSNIIGSIFYLNPAVDPSLYIAKNVQYCIDLKNFSDFSNPMEIFDYYPFQKHISFLPENEFRLILPYYYVDIIKIHKILFESDSFFLNIDLDFIYDGCMFYTCDFKRACNIIADIHSFQRKKLWFYSFDKGNQILFLKRIDLNRGSMGMSVAIRKLILGNDFDLPSFTSNIKNLQKHDFFNRRFITSTPGVYHKELKNIFKITKNSTDLSFEIVEHKFI